MKVAQLSRMVTAKDAAEVKRGVADGSVNIVVGTHALLAKGIEFADLGLLIVDEEQHFGVSHKEKLKALKADVHVLTLSATPIPRTLQLALTGVREMSLIATPPVDRLAVRTFIMPFDGVVAREAIQRERFRGGQIFCVVPRVEDMGKMADRLRAIVPEARITQAHGRLAPTELERVMTEFGDGKYDILLSTNIVESGLDMPAVNTLIIYRADMFGLGPAVSAARPGGPWQAARLRLPHLAVAAPAVCGGGEAAERDADAGHAGRRVHAGQPRPGHPRRRQPAGRRAERAHPRGRHRAVPADAGGCGGRDACRSAAAARTTTGTGRRTSRSACRC